MSEYECYVQEVICSLLYRPYLLKLTQSTLKPPFTLPSFVLTDWMKGLQQSDVLLTSSSHCLEREGIATIAKVLKAGRAVERVFAVGPLLPAESKEVLDLERTGSKAGDLNVFLDRIVQEKGPKSVLYVRGFNYHSAHSTNCSLIVFGRYHLVLCSIPHNQRWCSPSCTSSSASISPSSWFIVPNPLHSLLHFVNLSRHRRSCF